jgi:hypothetical protein
LPRKESVTARDGSVVYVEENPAITDEGPVDVAPRTNLCIVRPGAAPKLLLAGHGADEPSKILVGMSGLVADPGADFVYFSTSAWVTSSAAHAVSLTTGAETFLTDGTVLEVLTKGKHTGKLVMSHFRLDEAYPVSSPKYRGRMEMYSVVDRAGKTVLKLPEDAAARKAILAK